MKKDGKKNISDEAFLKQVKTTLDDATQAIDPATETRLRAMRREAVARAGKERWLLPTWQWGGAVAATVMVAILFTFNLQNENAGNNIESIAALEDLQMLSAADDLEMYQDLEFYSWLDEIQKTG